MSAKFPGGGGGGYDHLADSLSLIPNYKKNNGIKGSTTLVKVTSEQSTVLSFFGFSWNVSGQKLLVYYILILIHRGAKLYSQRRANLKILNSAPGLFGYN